MLRFNIENDIWTCTNADCGKKYTIVSKKIDESVVSHEQCPSCGNSLYFDKQALLWKCSNNDCLRSYSWDALLDSKEKAKSESSVKKDIPTEDNSRTATEYDNGQRDFSNIKWYSGLTELPLFTKFVIIFSILFLCFAGWGLFQNATRDAPINTYQFVYSSIGETIIGGNGHTIKLINNSTAVNPTYNQLLSFLAKDKTDNHAYIENSYVCGDYAEELHNNAEKAGIRAAFVGINDEHALNAFETTDRGLIYIDDQKEDLIATVIKGYPYAVTPVFEQNNSDYFYVSPVGIVKIVKIDW
jgi:ribosomal protein L37AE/L43A